MDSSETLSKSLDKNFSIDFCSMFVVSFAYSKKNYCDVCGAGSRCVPRARVCVCKYLLREMCVRERAKVVYKRSKYTHYTREPSYETEIRAWEVERRHTQTMTTFMIIFYYYFEFRWRPTQRILCVVSVYWCRESISRIIPFVVVPVWLHSTYVLSIFLTFY